MMDNTITVHNNVEESRYEVNVAEQLAKIDYKLQQQQISFTHTEVPSELGGRGIASTMARFALDEAQTLGYQVVPLCPFIASYIKKHPEYKSLVPEKHQHRVA